MRLDPAYRGLVSNAAPDDLSFAMEFDSPRPT